MTDTKLALSLANEFKDRLERAEAYLDECVEDLRNVDIATMRGLLSGRLRSDTETR